MKRVAWGLMILSLIFVFAAESEARKKDTEKEKTGLKEKLSLKSLRKAYEKAEGFYAEKKYTEAAEILRLLITEHPELQDPYVLLGKVYEATGKWELAVSTYRRLKEIDPNCVDAYYGIARTASKIETMLDFAIEACGKLLEFESKNPANMANIYFNLGLLYERVGQTDKAKTAYLKAIQLDDKFAAPRNNLALLYAEAREHLEEARQLANSAIDLDPRNSSYYDTRGFVHYQLKEYRSAIADYRKAMDIDASDQKPEDPGQYYRMSMAYYKYAEQMDPKHPFKARAGQLIRSGNSAVQDKTKSNEELGPEY